MLKSNSYTIIKPYLGIDYGHKRIGFALSDRLYLTANAIGFVKVDKNKGNALDKVLELAHMYDVSRIVVGIPFSLDGKENEKTKEFYQFIEQLKEHLDIPVDGWNEALTTHEAYRLLDMARVQNRKKRKEKRDALAAQVMLQDYLDCQRMEHSIS